MNKFIILIITIGAMLSLTLLSTAGAQPSIVDDYGAYTQVKVAIADDCVDVAPKGFPSSCSPIWACWQGAYARYDKSIIEAQGVYTNPHIRLGAVVRSTNQLQVIGIPAVINGAVAVVPGALVGFHHCTPLTVVVPIPGPTAAPIPGSGTPPNTDAPPIGFTG